MEFPLRTCPLATLLHANGWHMKTASEPLKEARKRIAATGGGEITSVKRLGAAP